MTKQEIERRDQLNRMIIKKVSKLYGRISDEVYHLENSLKHGRLKKMTEEEKLELLEIIETDFFKHLCAAD